MYWRFVSYSCFLPYLLKLFCFICKWFTAASCIRLNERTNSNPFVYGRTCQNTRRIDSPANNPLKSMDFFKNFPPEKYFLRWLPSICVHMVRNSWGWCFEAANAAGKMYFVVDFHTIRLLSQSLLAISDDLIKIEHTPMSNHRSVRNLEFVMWDHIALRICLFIKFYVRHTKSKRLLSVNRAQNDMNQFAMSIVIHTCKELQRKSSKCWEHVLMRKSWLSNDWNRYDWYRLHSSRCTYGRNHIVARSIATELPARSPL